MILNDEECGWLVRLKIKKLKYKSENVHDGFGYYHSVFIFHVLLLFLLPSSSSLQVCKLSYEEIYW